MFNFNEFILESEKDDSKLLPFRISIRVYDKLKKILSSDKDDKIAARIIEMDKNGDDAVITFVDITDENDKVSFVDSSKIKSEVDVEKEYIRNYVKRMDPGNRIWKIFRNDIKIGRLIRKILPDEFKDSEIEKFVNLWKSISDDDSKFEIYKGAKLRSGYESNNYVNLDKNSNSLMNSCMNDCLDFLDLYVDNAKLLVLLDDDDYITGRAILWETDQGINVIDRIYYAVESDYYKFIKWAKDNKYAYKMTNNSHCCSFFINGTEQKSKLTVTLKKPIENYGEYPYMDTFMYAKGKKLSTYTFEGSYYSLRDTGGEYEMENGEEDIHGNLIDDYNYYVISTEQGGYILNDDAIHIEYSSLYPGNSYDDWVEEEYLENSRLFTFSELDHRWYKIKHCVWSDYHNQWIWRENATYIMKDWVHWDYMKEFHDNNPDLKNPFLK